MFPVFRSFVAFGGQAADRIGPPATSFKYVVAGVSGAREVFGRLCGQRAERVQTPFVDVPDQVVQAETVGGLLSRAVGGHASQGIAYPFFPGRSTAVSPVPTQRIRSCRFRKEQVLRSDVPLCFGRQRVPAVRRKPSGSVLPFGEPAAELHRIEPRDAFDGA